MDVQRIFRRACLLLATLLVMGLRPSAGEAQTSGDCRIFNETQQSVCGLFLSYWDSHGGLAQQGFPISAPFVEKSEIDGQTRTVQYFERAVFEYHPENAGTPYEVELSLVGVQTYQRKYPGGAPNQQPNQDPGTVFFPETQKRMGGSFRQYWEAHGGLAQQGYPISDEFIERSALDPGKSYTVQYFQRAVFEYHPENKGTPYEVLLAQLGRYEYDRKYRPQPPPPPTNTPLPAATPTPRGPAGIGVKVPLADGVTIALSDQSGTERNSCGPFMLWKFIIENTTLNAFEINVDRQQVVQVDNNGLEYDPERGGGGSSCLGTRGGVGGVFTGDHRVLRHTASPGWLFIDINDPHPPDPSVVTFDARMTISGVAVQFRHPFRPHP